MEKLLTALVFTSCAAYAEVPVAKAKTIECYCTDSIGARVELGESICLDVGGRMFTAQCQMSLNVPMWRETQNGCLSSGLGGGFSPLDPNAHEHPIQTLSIHAHI